MHLLPLALLALGLSGTLACRADPAVYGFVDAQGELFLSNVPDNDQYRRIDAALAPEAGTRTRPASAAHTLRPYDKLVARAARECGIEAALLHAVISVESGYNPRALSKRGAAGLMQLMPETAKRFGVTDAFDPGANVRAGAQYLHELLTLFNNDIPLALAAYNAGEAAVLRYGRRIPPYRETVAYVPRVVRFYEALRL
jgi:soluble lytic murein transglycosylase-like protein